MRKTHELPSVSYADEQNSYLTSMGLSLEDITQSIVDGLSHFKRTTKLHPVTHAGSVAWGEINATLRALLIGKDIGWGHKHQDGLTITHNSDLGISIIATSGDRYTGNKNNIDPSTKNKKGPKARDIVISNSNLDLFEDNESNNICETIDNINAIDQTETWVLLYHFDKKQQEVRFELSLPKNISPIHGEEGKLRINRWRKRIIFNSISFDRSIDSRIGKLNGSTEEISFEISKK
ncbi:hypothetical protein [Sessilibacter corallicola]|uniref:hypothetical protein n=1 Tax=Sessilibacter corallicola TaxID=2904075 RepID=UPI001E5F7C0C|nr:hypothetical protein [Sessilibacter corallicola]MCE2027022.1 hypothetical protein [Sessilibacter corallicola]